MKMSTVEKVFVNSPGHSNRVSKRAERLLNQISFVAGQTYLDVGCGNGAAPVHLAKTYQLRVTGVDVDAAQIDEAEKRSEGISNARFLTVDGVDLPFADAEFDIVATNKVMHHVADWERAFVQMVRVLKPGGFLIFGDLIFPKWLAAIGRRFAKNRAGFPTRAAIDRLVEAHQLQRIHFSASLAQIEAIFRKPKMEN